MESEILKKLTELFQAFPGIGPRQAKRFSYSLLDQNREFVKNLSALLSQLKDKVKRCAICFYAFENGSAKECHFCRDKKRDLSTLLVAEKDVDVENIEKSQIYRGLYHVLGGLISPLYPDSHKKLRFKELFKRLQNNEKIKEVIVAFSANTEGDATALYIERILEPFLKKGLKITRLGRGLSTGAELEYSDRNTLKNALENRK